MKEVRDRRRGRLRAASLWRQEDDAGELLHEFTCQYLLIDQRRRLAHRDGRERGPRGDELARCTDALRSDPPLRARRRRRSARASSTAPGIPAIPTRRAGSTSASFARRHPRRDDSRRAKRRGRAWSASSRSTSRQSFVHQPLCRAATCRAAASARRCSRSARGAGRRQAPRSNARSRNPQALAFYRHLGWTRRADGQASTRSSAPGCACTAP